MFYSICITFNVKSYEVTKNVDAEIFLCILLYRFLIVFELPSFSPYFICGSGLKCILKSALKCYF